MKTPFTLDSKKLAGYSAMAASFIAINKSDAQIVYTDIIPDTSLYVHYRGEDLFFMDLNGDGQSDLKMRIYVTGGSEWSTAYLDAIPAPDLAMIHKQKGGIAALSSSFEINHPIPFPYKWNRGPELAWRFYSDWGHHYTVGQWINKIGIPSYIGFVLNQGSNNYFGWIRCNIVEEESGWDHKIIVYDYAINLTPNAPIKTGQISDDGLMVKDKDVLKQRQTTAEAAAIIFSGNKFISVQLKDQGFLNGLLEIYNLQGQRIFSNNITNPEFSIALPEVPDGIYILSLTQGGKRKTLKVLL